MLLLADHDLVEVETKKQDYFTEEKVPADKRQREAARRLQRLISSDVLADFADCYSAGSLCQALADGWAADPVTLSHILLWRHDVLEYGFQPMLRLLSAL